MKRNENSLTDLWDNINHTNIQIIWAPEEEEKKKEYEKIFEEMIVDGKRNSTEVQEAQRVPNRINPRQNTAKSHINQINKYQTQRTNIKSSKGKTTNNTQGDSHKDNS